VLEDTYSTDVSAIAIGEMVLHDGGGGNCVTGVGGGGVGGGGSLSATKKRTTKTAVNPTKRGKSTSASGSNNPKSKSKSKKRTTTQMSESATTSVPHGIDDDEEFGEWAMSSSSFAPGLHPLSGIGMEMGEMDYNDKGGYM
jgi:hypothetical protein